MNLKEFQIKLKEIKAKGFIRSKRRGPTGVGYTLEYELGIEENNIPLPDLGFAELKTIRENSKSLITLFTFNKKAWQLPPMEAIKKYGSYDKNKRKGLYYTITKNPNSAGLFLNCDYETINIQHTSGEVIVSWTMDSVAANFSKKVKNLILVTSRFESRDGREYFHYYRARILRGSPDKKGLYNAFEAGDIVIDLRLHDKETMTRNHGTAFRVQENKLIHLFLNISEIQL